jgi:Ricin-type beta-trefoil lectin domain
MNKRLLHILISICIIIIVSVIMLVSFKYKSNNICYEDYSNEKACSIAQYFTQDGKYSNDPNSANYWLKQQSSSEKELYDTLLKDISEAEAIGNTADASVLRSKMDDLQQMRLNLRTKALDTLEQSLQVQERDLGTIPKPNSCTVKPNPIKVFEISGDTCSIATVIGGKHNIYSFPDILKPTKQDNVFTADKIESCYITVPTNVTLDTSLVMVLNVLDAIGEKLNVPILNEIYRIIEETRDISRRIDVLRNRTIPDSRSRLQDSISSYNTTRQSINSIKRKIRDTKNSNKIIEDQNNKYSKDVDDIVEIYEHCNGQGRKGILKMGMTSFTEDNARFSDVSSIYFNDSKGLYVIMYDKNYNPYTIRKSVDCLDNVNIGGRNGVNLNDNVIAIEVIKSNKRPSNSMIASAANQKKVLDVAGWSTNNLGTVFGWEGHGGNNQKWTYNNDTKNVVSTHSGKCLDALYGGTNNFTKIIQYDCHGGNNMKWDFLQNGLIRNVNAQKCLQADPNNTNNNGFDVYLYDCDSNSQYQQWSVIDDMSHKRPKPIPEVSVVPPPPPPPAPAPAPVPQVPAPPSIWQRRYRGRRIR